MNILLFDLHDLVIDPEGEFMAYDTGSGWKYEDLNRPHLGKTQQLNKNPAKPQIIHPSSELEIQFKGASVNDLILEIDRKTPVSIEHPEFSKEKLSISSEGDIGDEDLSKSFTSNITLQFAIFHLNELIFKPVCSMER